MPPKRKKQTESTGRKLKSVEEWLLASWTLPGSVPVPRISLANKDPGPTSVDQFKRSLRHNWSAPHPNGATWELLPQGETLIVLTPRIGRICRKYNRNSAFGIAVYNFIRAASSSSTLTEWRPGGFLDFDWLQPDGTSTFQAYDDHALAVRDANKRSMFYWDGTAASANAASKAVGLSAVYISFNGTTSSGDATGAQIELWQYTNNEWQLFSETAIVAATQSYNLKIPHSGYWAVAVPGLTPATRNAGAVMQAFTGSAVMQTYGIEQLFQNATDIDLIRVNGNSGRLTDIVAPLNAEGATTGTEIVGEDWLDYLQDCIAGTSTSIYDAIADVRGAEEPHALIRGKYGYNKVRNRNMLRVFDVAFEDASIEYVGDPALVEDFTYVIVAFSAATSGTAAGADALLTLNTSVEFSGRNKWNTAVPSNIDPVTVELAQFKLNAAPTGADNPGHIATFLGWIGSAVAGAAPFLAAIPAVGPIAAGVAGAAGVGAAALGAAINYFDS